LIEQLQREMSGVNFETIDVDVSPDLALKYEVRSIPTLVFEKGGQELKRTLGVQTKSTLLSILNSL
jgi:thioredoxin 1